MMDALEDEIPNLNEDFETLLTEEFGPILDMFETVKRGVVNCYDQVQLRDGLESCEWNLLRIHGLFSTVVDQFCDASTQVCNAFVDGGKAATTQSSQLCMDAATKSDKVGMLKMLPLGACNTKSV